MARGFRVSQRNPYPEGHSRSASGNVVPPDGASYRSSERQVEATHRLGTRLHDIERFLFGKAPEAPIAALRGSARRSSASVLQATREDAIVEVLPSIHFETVTSRNVAGIEVTSFREPAFWALNSASSSDWSSASSPASPAASKAFIVGP